MTEDTPALYRTTVTHVRRAPVHHRFSYRGYCWYVDVDALPRPPWWLRPFARFDPRDHLSGAEHDTLRQRVDSYLTAQGLPLPGGRITALLQARVLGYVFNPLSLYWCHDTDGTLRAVIAEVHNTYGQRHAYLLPTEGNQPVSVAKQMYVSPFNDVDGRYLVRAPRPGKSPANGRRRQHWWLRHTSAARLRPYRGTAATARLRQLPGCAMLPPSA
mgnify:CR=1 FL=1